MAHSLRGYSPSCWAGKVAEHEMTAHIVSASQEGETEGAVPLSFPSCSVWDPSLWDAAATFRVGHSSQA